MENQTQMTDREFDGELDLLVAKAIRSGVHPAVVIGCLQMSVMDVWGWNDRNQALLREVREKAKAKEFVGAALSIVQPNGKEVIEAAEKIYKTPSDKPPAAPGIAGILESETSAAIVVKE